MMRLIAPSASLTLTLCNGARLIREKKQKTQMKQNKSRFRKEKTQKREFLTLFPHFPIVGMPTTAFRQPV